MSRRLLQAADRASDEPSVRKDVLAAAMAVCLGCLLLDGGGAASPDSCDQRRFVCASINALLLLVAAATWCGLQQTLHQLPAATRVQQCTL